VLAACKDFVGGDAKNKCTGWSSSTLGDFLGEEEGACGTNPLLTFILTSMYVFFLTRPRILEPHLRHTLAETGHRGDPLQILAIRITVNLEVGLQHLQLLLGEGGAHPFRLALVITIAITALWNCGKGKGV